MDIREDETLEDLQLNGLKLFQKKRGFRLSMDSVLLADFAEIRPGARVVDLGTGSGVLLLLLWGRDKGTTFYGIEIQQEYAEMAERTVRLNHLEEQITILHSDIKEAASYIELHSIDAVICNPPYPVRDSRVISTVDPGQGIARMQTSESLHEFLNASYQLLKEKGKLFIVYPAPEMVEMITAMRQNHLEPKRLRMVYSFADREAKLVLIEAVKGGRPTLMAMPPLIVYEGNGCLTNELKSIYHIKE